MAPDTTTEQPAEAVDDRPEALAQLTLTFMVDGGIHMGVAGDLRPAVAWAFADFLRNVGDDMFAMAKQEALAKVRAAEQRSAAGRLVVPGTEFTRLPR